MSDQPEFDPRQLFLKEEVLDKGLEVEACEQFLTSLKPNGDSIENWTLEELKEAVEKFKLKISEASHQHQQPEQVENEPQSEECFKCVPSELTSGEQKIRIAGYKKESAGLFKSSYIAYQIETQPIGWTVFRRYSDFEWLRTALQKQFPSFIIPPIHKKRTKRSFEDLYLLKRQIFLERFFASIQKSTELLSSQALRMFLCCQNADEFKIFQEKFNKIPAPQSAQKMYTKDGLVNTAAAPETLQYVALTGDYFANLDQVYKKIRIISKSLKEVQLQSATKIQNIGDIFAQLFHSVNKMNQSLQIGQAKGLASTFLNLHSTMVTWGTVITKQVDQIEQFFNSLFKYQQHYNISIKSLYQARQLLSQDLEKFKAKLNYKKERLFEVGDFSKWEVSKEFQGNVAALLNDKKGAFAIMCDQETKLEKSLTSLLGFYTNQIYYQTQEYFRDQQLELANHFIKYFQVQTMNITDYHQLWADAISNLQNNLIVKQSIAPTTAGEQS